VLLLCLDPSLIETVSAHFRNTEPTNTYELEFPAIIVNLLILSQFSFHPEVLIPVPSYLDIEESI
jgi:hypothetical protein